MASTRQHPSLESDDEFFGKYGEETDSSSHQLESDTMTTCETKAREAQFRNIGYREAFDQSRETRLQEGFDHGYKEIHDIAFRIGDLLGELTAKTLFRGSSDASFLSDHHDGRTDDEPVERPKSVLFGASKSVEQCLQQIDQGAIDGHESESLQRLEAQLLEITASSNIVNSVLE